MRYLLIAKIIALLSLSLDSYAQCNVQMGELGVFSETKSLVIDSGTQPIKIKEYSKLSSPVFGAVRHYYPQPKQNIFTSIDFANGIFPTEVTSFGSVRLTGMRSGKHLVSSAQVRSITTLNLSAGTLSTLPVKASMLSQIRKSVTFKSEDEYFKKSKRQKITGWILLGTGIALIGSSIAIAYHQKDPLTGAATLVYVGGPGIVRLL